MELVAIILLASVAVAAAVACFMILKSKSALETGLADKNGEVERLKGRLMEVEKENAALQMKLQSQEEYAEKMSALHKDALEKVAEQHKKDMNLMRDQFKAAAADITTQNTKEFKEQSAGRIADLLSPLKEKFEEFTKSMDASKTTSVEMKTSLEEQIKNLVSQSDKVSSEARNLANALTGRSKVQGDFGELILKDILLNAGLMEGVHFRCQGVMTDADGHEIKSEDSKTMIPDVLVYYPDSTMVVVDSKVSLTAYVAYTAAMNDEEKKIAAMQHIESVRKHINELAGKDYASYIPDDKKKVDYNIMFIPNEGAFHLILEQAPSLWQEAKNRNVLIVSQMTLIIVLNMIQMVWKQSEKEKNIEAVHAAASELMGQIQSWLGYHINLGEQIKKLSSVYEDSSKKLTESKQSVVAKIRKLEGLGAAPKRNAVKAVSRKGSSNSSESVIPAELSELTE